MEDPKHPAFIPALRWATEYGYGKPSQTIELTGRAGGPVELNDQPSALETLRAKIELIRDRLKATDGIVQSSKPASKRD